MRIRILYTILVIFCLPIFLTGQQANPPSPNNGNSVLTFTPASKLKKRNQTRFRKQYFGVLNGKEMELSISERKYQERLELEVNLTDSKARQTFIGTKFINKTTHHLDSLVLKNKLGEMKTIKSLFLHNYNPNFINIITTKGEVGYFFWGEKPVANGYYAKPFISFESYRGYYEGRIDGRLAEMRIETRANGIQIVINDKEQRQKYWTYLVDLPKGQRFFSIGSLRLKSTTSAKAITIKNLVLDKDNTQIISGSFEQRKKEVGLFFIRKAGVPPTVLPEFPWPPPVPSDYVKIDLDSLIAIDYLGGLDSLICQRLKDSGYNLRPNKYFYSPNGFTLVTQIEQIDCEGKPLASSDRWNINISEFEKDFNLIDYLRALSTEKEGFYRVMAFVITDDLTPLSRIDPTLVEEEAWLISGSAMLPDDIANLKLTDKHYGRIYVYEFNKNAGSIHAEMVKKGKHDCWRAGETHLEFFENFNKK